MKTFRKALIPAIIAAVGILLIGGVVIMAATGWPVSHSVPASGTVTVAPSPTPTPTPVAASDDFSITTTSVDLTASIGYNTVYTKIIPVTIHNTGTAEVNGGGGGNAIITSVSASATGLPTGWTCTGSLVEASVTPGSTGTVNVTISSVSPLLNTVTPSAVTVTLSASGT